MRSLFLLLLLPVLMTPAFAQQFQQLPTDKGTLLVNISTDPESPGINELTKVKIDFINPNTNAIQEHIDYKVTVTRGDALVFGPIPLTHTSIGSVTIPVEFRENGEHKIKIDVEGILFQPIPMETVAFTTVIGKAAAEQPADNGQGGGCLIATAAYGTEMASQVQLLREVRDNVVFGTSSGATFMAGFNSFYYSFSPTVADWERQSPIFRDAVRLTLTPMLSSLSILSYADINSEQEMLGYGIGVILLNAGMYLAVPAIIITKIRRK
ncbi:MAG: copper-binding protein [Candidatus Nitrosotenuis sp.]|nr:copper-binding protein [Candidatus Nitrosotenuis sp.]